MPFSYKIPHAIAVVALACTSACGGSSPPVTRATVAARPAQSPVTPSAVTVRRPSESIAADLTSAGLGRVYVVTAPQTDLVDAPEATANRWTSTTANVAWRIVGPAVGGFVPIMISHASADARSRAGCWGDPQVRTLLPVEIQAYASLASLSQALREDLDIDTEGGARVRALTGAVAVADGSTVRLVDEHLSVRIDPERAASVAFDWSYVCPAGGCVGQLVGTEETPGCALPPRDETLTTGFGRVEVHGASRQRGARAATAHLASRCMVIDHPVADPGALACGRVTAQLAPPRPAEAQTPEIHATHLDFGGVDYARPDEPARGRVRFVGEPEVSEGLYIEEVREGVAAQYASVLSCYEDGLLAEANLAGFLTLRFTIGPNGAVTLADVADSTLEQAPVDRCIAAAVRRWTFPVPDAGLSVRVSYPVMLSPPPMTVRIAAGAPLYSVDGSRVGRVLEETSVGLDEEHSNAARRCFAVPLAGPVMRHAPLFVCLGRP